MERVARNPMYAIHRAWLPHCSIPAAKKRKNTPKAMPTAVVMWRVRVSPINTPSHTKAAMPAMGMAAHHHR